MPAGGDFPYLTSISELDHADDALIHIKLVHIFVVLFVLQKWDQLFELLNSLLVLPESLFLS